MIVLGVIGGFHDAAACLLVDGKVVALAEEERFTRKKHAFEAFPDLAAEYCLKEAGILWRDIDRVSYSFDLDRLIRTNESIEPWRSAFAKDDRHRLRFKQYYWGIKERAESWCLSRNLPAPDFVPHHDAHLASAFFGSDFDTAAVLSVDSRGEDESAVMAVGEGSKIRVVGSVPLPHSLGMLYTIITRHLGYQMYDGEGTIMGLAPYGEDRYRELFDEIVAETQEAFAIRGDYLWNRDTDGFLDIANPWDAKIGPARPYRPDPRDGVDEHIAASLQACLTRHAKALVKKLGAKTGQKRFALAGGVALNSKMNGELLYLDEVEDLYVQPLANDAGGALGGAMFLYNKLTGKRPEPITDVRLGPAIRDDEARREIERRGLKPSTPKDMAGAVADMLAAGKVVGWAQGRMEAGPRALGSRSILADPSRKDAKDKVNKRVKNREPWRPFAATILRPHRDEYLENCEKAPFMIVCYKARGGAFAKIEGGSHVDGTCRAQILERDSNPLFYDMIEKFGHKTGVYAALNTSFNLRGEPMIRGAEEALDIYLKSDMDAIAIGSYLLEKKND